MRKRGFTLTELMVSMAIMSLLVIGAGNLFVAGLRKYANTEADVDVTQSNTIGIQRVVEKVRQSMSTQIGEGGMWVIYSLPKFANTASATTGEKELLTPVQADGVFRAFVVYNGQLWDTVSNRVLVKNIVATDPDPGSSQYGQPYAPFSLTTIGSRRALTVNLITQRRTASGPRYARFKTTFIIRNSL